jgi:hypothetical protein
MGDLLLVPALRRRSPHHQPDADRENRHFHTAFELRDWGHMLTACDYLSLNGYKLLWGPGATASATTCSPTTARRTG